MHTCVKCVMFAAGDPVYGFGSAGANACKDACIPN